jgi:hypothetical protein
VYPIGFDDGMHGDRASERRAGTNMHACSSQRELIGTGAFVRLFANLSVLLAVAPAGAHVRC